jgi:Chitobiase/beta-hexosaminidase C-terminal domain
MLRPMPLSRPLSKPHKTWRWPHRQRSRQLSRQLSRPCRMPSRQISRPCRPHSTISSRPTREPSGYGRSDKPTFSPRSGKYSSPTTVTMTVNVPKASIYYTTDGSAPTPNSNLYTHPIQISSSTQLRAMSQSPIYSASRVANAKYVIAPAPQSIPSSPQSGTGHHP